MNFAPSNFFDIYLNINMNIFWEQCLYVVRIVVLYLFLILNDHIEEKGQNRIISILESDAVKIELKNSCSDVAFQVDLIFILFCVVLIKW